MGSASSLPATIAQVWRKVSRRSQGTRGAAGGEGGVGGAAAGGRGAEGRSGGGAAVQGEPREQPHKTQRPCDDKRPAPAPIQRDPRHDERREDRAGVGAGIEDAGGQGALFLGEPFPHAFDGAGKVGGLAQAEQGARGGERRAEG